MLRSVVFFYIKTPLRVKEAGLEELIPTTWWPTRFDKEVSGPPEHHKAVRPGQGDARHIYSCSVFHT